MNKNLLTILSVFLFVNLFAQTNGQSTSSISWSNFAGTQNRNMTIYVPDNYNSENSYKLIIGFHGLGDTHGNYIGALIPYCTDSYYGNVIAVSLQYSDWDENLHDDGIIPATIQHISETYNIDAENIYLEGFSVGGISSTYRGLENADVIRGIITNSGAMAGMEDAENSCTTGACKDYDYNRTNEVFACFTSSPEYETGFCSGAADPCNSSNTFYAVNSGIADIFNSNTSGSALFIDNPNNCHCLPTVDVNHQCWDHVSQVVSTTVPVASFTANTSSIFEGESVTFTDASNEGGAPIEAWEWTFTGGNPSEYTGQTPPAISYSNIGSYEVSLTVTNSHGSDTRTISNYINVSLEPYGVWQEQATAFSDPSRGITNISIVDENIVWACAYDGSSNNANVQEFTKTTDGGETWLSGDINVGNSSLGIAMIQGIDENTAYAVAYVQSSGQQGIFITTDAGASWTRQTTAEFTSGSSFSNVVHFWNANDGFCQGDPINGEYELYTTTNGGENWILVPGENIPNPETGEYGYTGGIETIGDHVWFTTNHGRLYHSEDKGYNWDVFNTPISDFGAKANVSFKDQNNGIIIDENGNIYTTSNGGANWESVTSIGDVFNIGLCWVEGTNIIFSTGQAGSSYSNDGGLSWNLIDTDRHTAVEFINQSVGWSGFFNVSASEKGIWKWKDTSTSIPVFASKAKDLRIYPNPTTGKIIIDIANVTKIEVYNLSGRIIKTSISKELDLSNETKGIYFVKVITNNNTSMHKIILE